MKYDIILIDCYTGTGQHPYNLSTIEFYEVCKSHLTDNGMVSTNLIESDPLYTQKVNTFAKSFEYVYDFHHEGAHVFLGTNSFVKISDVILKAQEINAKHRFHFPFMERASSLQMYNSFFEEVLLDSEKAKYVPESAVKDDQAYRGVGRNELCPCGSGKKYKKCHGRYK